MGWLDSWLGTKAAPGPDAVPLRAAIDGWARSGFARSSDARVREVFDDNPVGQRSVRLVAGALGGLTVEGFGDAGDAAARLVTPALMETIGAQLLLHGNAYVHALDDGAGTLADLMPLRPERVSVATDEKGWASAFLYRVGGRRPRRIEAIDALGRRRIAHVKALGPADDHYGAGCLSAAIGPASVHNAASKWNMALLENAARPSGALVHDPGDGSALSSEQFDRLKAEMAAQFEGAANAGKPLLLDGGLKWQALSMSPADMDFLALKEAAARDVALAFGVPPVLLGLPGDATYSNAREAGRALYRQTVLPLAAKVLGALGPLLSDWFGDVSLKVDEDRLSELAEDRSKLWAQVGAAEFLSRDEKRAMLGFTEAGDE